LTTTNL